MEQQHEQGYVCYFFFYSEQRDLFVFLNTSLSTRYTYEEKKSSVFWYLFDGFSLPWICNFKFALGVHRVASFKQPLCKIAWSVREYLHDIDWMGLNKLNKYMYTHILGCITRLFLEQEYFFFYSNDIKNAIECLLIKLPYKFSIENIQPTRNISYNIEIWFLNLRSGNVYIAE